jgi:hypothetical protein
MILDIFIVLLSICLFLIWFGVYSKRKLFSIVGFSIFFILSSWIILYSSASWLLPQVPVGSTLSGLEYKNATIVSTVGSVSTISNTYVIYNDVTTFWVGLILEITCLFGLVITWEREE